MKKLLIVSLSFVLFLSLTPVFSAASYRDVDMMGDGTWYSFSFYNGDYSDAIWGRLTNRDAYYGTSWSGYGNVKLKEDNDGSWATICNNDEYLTPNGDYTQCNDSWYNKNENFKTYGSYDYVDNGELCVHNYSLWSRLE